MSTPVTLKPDIWHGHGFSPCLGKECTEIEVSDYLIWVCCHELYALLKQVYTF